MVHLLSMHRQKKKRQFARILFIQQQLRTQHKNYLKQTRYQSLIALVLEKNKRLYLSHLYFRDQWLVFVKVLWDILLLLCMYMTLSYIYIHIQLMNLSVSIKEETRILDESFQKLSCEVLIKFIRRQFIKKIKNFKPMKFLIEYSRICTQFCTNNQTQSTVTKITAFFRSLEVPMSNPTNFLSQLFNKKLQSEQAIQFDNSIQTQYKKLGIRQFLELPPKTEISKDGSKLIFSGPFIHLNLVKTFSKIENIKQVQIRAFIEILVQGGPASVIFTSVNASIFSPLWTLENDTCIFLTGEDGANYLQRAPGGFETKFSNSNPFWRKSDQQKYRSAEDGQPGRPGKPGPNFVGAGIMLSSSTNLVNMQIKTKGGNGGNGQDAGNGLILRNFQDWHDLMYEKRIGHYYESEIKKELFYLEKVQSGKRGNRGIGGQPGFLQIYSLETNQKLIAIKKRKQIGEYGQFGNPGIGGRINDDQIKPELEIASTIIQPDLPKPALGYESIVRYQNDLVQLLLSGQGLQKDIIFVNLLNFMSYNLTNPNSQSKMEIRHLIDEVNLIAKLYSKFLFNENFLTSQQMTQLVVGFKQKLAQFIQDSFSQITPSHEEVLHLIATNIVIMEKSLKMAFTVLNFDYLSYFLTTTNASFQYKKILQQQASVKQKYFNKLNQKIKQAESVTEEMQKQISTVTTKIIDESDKLIDQMKQAQKKKEQYAQKLLQQLPWRILGKILNFAGKVASSAGPEGEAVGEVLGKAQTVIDVLTPPPEAFSGKDLNPSTYLDMNNGFNAGKVAEVVNGLRQFNPDLPPIEKIKQDMERDKNVKEYLQFVEKALQETNNILKKIAEHKKDKKQKQKSDDIQTNKEEAKNLKKRKKLILAKNALKAIQIAIEAVCAKDDSLHTFLNDYIDEFDQVSKSQQDRDKFINLRLKIQSFISNTMKNFMQRMRDINEVFSEAGSRSRIIFLEYGFRATLNDILQQFKNSFEMFQSQNKQNFFYLFTKLETATQSLSQIYGVIDNYKSQGQLAQLIIDINPPLGKDLEKIYPGLTQIKDNFEKLLVYKEGSDILNSFKQSTFPRSPYYSYDAYYKIANKEHTDSLEEMMKQLKDIYHKHMLNKYMLGDGTQTFLNTDTKAVYFTSSQEFEIVNLLHGEAVTMLPDVRLSQKDRDAIKFRTIYIRFQLAPGATEEMKASLQKIQQKLLTDASVEMTSSGNYFYRYSQVYYNLPSTQLELFHSYNPQGSISNDVFKIVANGEPMFSPYTSWKLKLKTSLFSNPDFQADVEKCRSKLQLTFYGTAIYIDNTSFESQAKLRIPVHECYSSFEAKELSILPQV